jgi:hypothetical protein
MIDSKKDQTWPLFSRVRVECRDIVKKCNVHSYKCWKMGGMWTIEPFNVRKSLGGKQHFRRDFKLGIIIVSHHALYIESERLEFKKFIWEIHEHQKRSMIT